MSLTDLDILIIKLVTTCKYTLDFDSTNVWFSARDRSINSQYEKNTSSKHTFESLTFNPNNNNNNDDDE